MRLNITTLKRVFDSEQVEGPERKVSMNSTTVLYHQKCKMDLS